MADVKLPPLPPRVPVDKHLPTGVVIYGYTNDMMCDYARDYARANVAAKDAEIEALRAEVRRLNFEVDAAAIYGDDRDAHYLQAETRAERLAEALRALLPFVATQAVGCHGDKCRESWCYSCSGEEEADEAAERGREACHAARALLREQEEGNG